MAGHGCLPFSLLSMVGLLAFSHVMYGEEYLLSFVEDALASYVFAQTAKSGSWTQRENQPRRNLTPHNRNEHVITMYTTSGIENKSIIINVSDRNVKIYGVYDRTIFSSLPISALGTKYIVSSCHPPGIYTSVLMITTHSQKTDVDITFRLEGNVTYDGRTYSNGDTLTLSLEEYQTFTIRSEFDLTGTVVNTKQSVAVFSIRRDEKRVRGSVQLLPVRHYGQEYVVATSGHSISQLQIVSEHSDTQIMFNNGSTAYVGEDDLYQQYLTQNVSLHFSSSRPVMATLCNQGEDGFVIVPPLRLYIKDTSFYSYGLFKVLTYNDATISVAGSTLTFNDQGQWEKIPDTRYKGGTWVIDRAPIVITSNTSFTVLMVDGSLNNGGYNFQSTQTRCDRDHYGSDCVRSCGNRHCNGDSSCSPSTGQCDGGCQARWVGIDCTEPITMTKTSTVIVGGIVAAVLVLVLVVIVGIVVWRRKRAYSASERNNTNSSPSGIHHKTGSEAIDMTRNISIDDKQSRVMSRKPVSERTDIHSD